MTKEMISISPLWTFLFYVAKFWQYLHMEYIYHRDTVFHRLWFLSWFPWWSVTAKEEFPVSSVPIGWIGVIPSKYFCRHQNICVTDCQGYVLLFAVVKHKILRCEIYFYVGIIAVYTIIALSLIGCSCHHDTWSLCMEQEMLPL